MKQFHLRVPSAEDWQRFYDPKIEDGGIFCPSNDPPEIGTEVRIEITFVSGPRLFINGTVTWRRPQLKDPRARAGAGVKVHPGEKNKLNYINAWVRGGMMDKREVRRIPVKIRVTYSARSGRRINFTRDISKEGIFIYSQELIELNTPIKLLLMPPKDFGPFDLMGVVTRHVDDGEERGMGIHLTFENSSHQHRFEAFIQKLEQQYLNGQLPDDVVG